MAAAAVCIQSLPPEVLEMILDHVEEYPPSYFGFSIQPSLSLISSKYRYPPLKSFSRVSRAFRRIIIPRLFQCTLHLVTIEARNQELSNGWQSLSGWPRKFWEFVTFLEEMQLGHVVRSFTLAIKEHPELDGVGRLKYLPREAAEYQHRWIHLFSHAAPFLSRVTIVAPPHLLGILTGMSLKSLSSVIHVPYQILGLWIYPFLGPRHPPHAEEFFSDQLPLLTARRWTHLLVNEGSFMRKLIPTTRGDLDQCKFISSELCALQQKQNILSEIWSVSYTAAYPPITHIRKVKRLLAALPRLAEFQFTLSLTALLCDPYTSREPDPEVMKRLWHNMYTEFSYIKSEADEFAQELNVESCLEHLKLSLCVERLGPDEIYKVVDATMNDCLWQGICDSSIRRWMVTF